MKVCKYCGAVNADNSSECSACGGREFKYKCENFCTEFDDGLYTAEYTRNKIIEKQRKIAREKDVTSLDEYRLEPNSMQVGFINNLKKIYEIGKNKALLVSATGERFIMMTA